MNIILKKSDILDFSIFFLSILNIMIFRWLGISNHFNYILLILLLTAMVRDIGSYIKSHLILYFLAILAYAVINKQLTGGDYVTLFNNIKAIMVPSLLLLYFSNILKTKKYLFKYLYDKSFWLFNGYVLLNIPVFLLQLTGNYALNGFENNTNTYAVDLVTGFFGANMMPNVALYSAFIIVYNYYLATQKPKESKKRLTILTYDFILLIFFSILSLLNDNKFFYIIILVYSAVYYIAVVQNQTKDETKPRRIKKYFKKIVSYIAGGIIVVLGLYNFTPIKDPINDMIHDFSIGIEKSALVQGSNERFGMISFILQDKVHKWFGYGIGYTSWTTPYTFGFVHYGQADMGTFMCLGGIWMAIIIIVYVNRCIGRCISFAMLRVLLTLTLALLCIYTQLFTVTIIMGCALLFVGLCSVKNGYSV